MVQKPGQKGRRTRVGGEAFSAELEMAESTQALLLG